MIYLINAESLATEVNTGMKTVDIAWDIFLKRNKIETPYKRFSLKADKQNIQITDKISLDYEGYLSFDFDLLKEDDILVYWGDFIHSNHYLKNDLLRITNKKRRDINTYIPKLLKHKKLQKFNKKEYLDVVYQFYLLENIKDKKWKGTISFGTTLVGDNDFELVYDTRYANTFKKFVKELDYMWTRDVYSALQISHIRGEYSKNFLGVDAALLIGSEDYDTFLDEPTIQTPNKNYVVTHFTRTEASINQLLGLADKISNELDMPLYWLPWLTSFNDNKFQNMDEKFRKSISNIEATNYSDLIHSLRGASLVVTDTYHLALVAWRLRIPVVCIGSGLQYPTSSVHDKKKEIFYSMHNILPLYFYAELLENSDAITEYTQRIKREFKTKKAFENIFNKIENQAQSIEKDLANYLREKIL